MNEIKATFIHWVDARMDDGVYDGSYHYGIGVITMGFIVDENEDALSIAFEIFEDEDARNVMTIPKPLILARIDLDFGSMEVILNATEQAIKEKTAPGDKQGDVESNEGSSLIRNY